MMTKYDIALKAIQELHGDDSISYEDCLEKLQDLQGELEMLIVAIEADINNRDEG